MTYTEAARINSQFNLKWFFKDPKRLGDGVSLRWFKDTQGRIGYVRGVIRRVFWLCTLCSL